MTTSQSSGFGRPLDWYDGLAGLVVLVVLGTAFLVLFQPLLGLLLTVAFISTYEAFRRDTIKHSAVVAGLWMLFITSSFLLTTTVQIVATGVLALAVYVSWRITQ